ncbi:MAG: hypothetical protein MZV63_58835 [Marinilabiliales bacterium]|nr:hypothetical protein [Marinilabiliales bacterium]
MNPDPHEAPRRSGPRPPRPARRLRVLRFARKSLRPGRRRSEPPARHRRHAPPRPAELLQRGPPPDARDRRPGRPRRPLRAGLLPRAADPALPRQHPPRRDLARPRRRRQRPGRRPPRVPQPGQDAQGGRVLDRGLRIRVPARLPVRARRGLRRLRRQIPGPGRRRSRLPRAPGREDRRCRPRMALRPERQVVPLGPRLRSPCALRPARAVRLPLRRRSLFRRSRLRRRGAGQALRRPRHPGRDRPDRRRPDRRPRGISGRARRDDPRLFRLQRDSLGPARRGRPRDRAPPRERPGQPRRSFPHGLRPPRSRRASRPSRPVPPPAPRGPVDEIPAHLFRSPGSVPSPRGGAAPRPPRRREEILRFPDPGALRHRR